MITNLKFVIILVLIFIFNNSIGREKIEESKKTKHDTITIDPSKVNTSFIKPGTKRYLVYFTIGKGAPRSRAQFWTIKTTLEEYEGRDVIVISQEWEDRDTIVHKVKSICDRKTLAPLFQQSWWKQTGYTEFDFIKKTGSINNIALADSDTAKIRARVWGAFKKAANQFVLNWHVDLQVFSVLPYKNGVSYIIPYYDPGSRPPSEEVYTVEGSAKLKGYNNEEIDCWLLTHYSRGFKETFWISKKTREVLKLDNEIGKDSKRYKILMAYSE